MAIINNPNSKNISTASRGLRTLDEGNILQQLLQISGTQVGRETDEPVYYTGEAANDFLGNKLSKHRAMAKMTESPEDSLSIGDAMMMFPHIKEDYLNKPNIENYLQGYKGSQLEGLKGREKRKQTNILDSLLNYFK